MMKKPEMTITRPIKGEEVTISLTLDELFRAHEKIQRWQDMGDVEMRYGHCLNDAEIEAVACRMRSNINKDDDSWLYAMDNAVYELGFEDKACA